MRLDDETRWAALTARDRSYDGRFFYGVATTGVYCRPSCPSRLPLRKNVRFFEDAAAAERAGLRPCARCRPSGAAYDDARLRRIAEACDLLRRDLDAPIDLAALAGRVGWSPFHLQRSFKAALGVTPRQFREACRLESLKRELRGGATVTDSIYEAGFGSASRVYERVDSRLGMTPGEYRRGGAGMAISWTSVPCALGRMSIAATDRGLCSVQFGGSDEELLALLRNEYPAAGIERMREPFPAEFQAWMSALQEHLEGREPRLELPLDVRASAFQMRVWRYLQSIPYGSVRSYGQVARGMGEPGAARAVARACAANRVALVIPCHRVVRGSGELGGYRWGTERKAALVRAESGGGEAGREPGRTQRGRPGRGMVAD